MQPILGDDDKTQEPNYSFSEYGSVLAHKPRPRTRQHVLCCLTAAIIPSIFSAGILVTALYAAFIPKAPTVNLSTMLANLTGITEGTVDGSGSTIGYVGFAFDFNNDNSIGLEFSDTSITVLQNSSQLANSTIPGFRAGGYDYSRKFALVVLTVPLGNTFEKIDTTDGSLPVSVDAHAFGKERIWNLFYAKTKVHVSCHLFINITTGESINRTCSNNGRQIDTGLS